MTHDRPTIHDLREPVETPDDGIVSRAIYTDDTVRAVLFSFAAGQALTDHTAPLPVTLQVVDGEAAITLGDDVVEARAGTWIHLPANTPHSANAPSI